MDRNKIVATDLENEIQAAETVDVETLLGILESHERALFVVELRLRGAQSASDTPRIEEFQRDAETQKKYRAYFLKQLNDAFPSVKPPKHDFREVEQQVVVNDYLQFTRLKRDAKLQYDAAVFTGNKTHADMAQMKVTRAMKYLAFYKPKFERFARQAK